EVSGGDADVGPVALDGSLEEGLHLAIDLLAQSADLALRDAAGAHRLDQVVNRAGRDALDVGFMDDCGERLLGQAARLQEAREVGALPELGNAQLDAAGACLPVAVPVAIALYQTQRARLSSCGPRSHWLGPSGSALF